MGEYGILVRGGHGGRTVGRLERLLYGWGSDGEDISFPDWFSFNMRPI